MKPKPTKPQRFKLLTFTELLNKWAKEWPVPLTQPPRWWNEPSLGTLPTMFWDRVDQLDMTKPQPK